MNVRSWSHDIIMNTFIIPQAANRTGRVIDPLRPQIQQILYAERMTAGRRQDFRVLAQCDRAQIVMLNRAGLLDARNSGRLLRAIEELEHDGFSRLTAGTCHRGTYIQWENALADITGPDLHGAAHLARSRNDLQAAICRIAGRAPCHRLILEVLRLLRVLMCRAMEWSNTIVAGYTNYQPAMPTTLGHQILAYATALERQVHHLMLAAAALDVCPLGAGAMAGTSLPIDPSLTATLLGFSSAALNSTDAVASRDFVLHIQSAAAVLAVTLSRIATDLLAMLSTPEPLLRLPDCVVGASSAMPQKRNPFVLEHVQGRGATALGSFVATAQATQATPYTNGIAAGIESVRNAWGGISDVADSATLLRFVLEAAVADKKRMAKAADAAYLNAAALAERLVACGMNLRTAHNVVGLAVTEAMMQGVDLAQVAPQFIRAAGFDPVVLGDGWKNVASIVPTLDYGGGPGPRSMEAQMGWLTSAVRQHMRSIHGRRQRYHISRRLLAEAVKTLRKDY